MATRKQKRAAGPESLVYRGEPGLVRVGDVPLKPGDVVTDPDMVADLRGRHDFELVTNEES